MTGPPAVARPAAWAGLSPPAWARLTAATAVLGVLYALSPLTLWCAAALAWLVWRAQRGLQGTERRWVVGLLGALLASRLLTIAALVFTTAPGTWTYPSFFGDGRYAIGRSLWLRGAWLGETMHPKFFLEAFEQYGANAYLYGLGVLQVLVGPATWAVHLVSILCFAGAVVVCHRAVRASFGRVPALIVLAVLVAHPTWLAWSVSPIKEAFQLLVVALGLLAARGALRSDSAVAARIAPAAGAAATVVVLAALRAGGLAITAGALAAGVASAVARRIPAATLAAVAAAVLTAGAAVAYEPVAARLGVEIDRAANRHVGHVRTPGRFYKLVDEHRYREVSEGPATLTPGERARFLVRAVIAFIVVPLPWHVDGTSALVLLPTQLAWYALLALAVIGLPHAARRDGVLTAMLAAYALLSVVVIAPNSGNVGTLIRHRDMMLPFLACLSAVGMAVAVGRRIERPAGAMEGQPA